MKKVDKHTHTDTHTQKHTHRNTHTDTNTQAIGLKPPHKFRLFVSFEIRDRNDFRERGSLTSVLRRHEDVRLFAVMYQITPFTRRHHMDAATKVN